MDCSVKIFKKLCTRIFLLVSDEFYPSSYTILRCKHVISTFLVHSINFESLNIRLKRYK